MIKFQQRTLPQVHGPKQPQTGTPLPSTGPWRPSMLPNIKLPSLSELNLPDAEICTPSIKKKVQPVMNSRDPKLWKCGLCKLSFFSKKALTSHSALNHRISKPQTSINGSSSPDEIIIDDVEVQVNKVDNNNKNMGNIKNGKAWPRVKLFRCEHCDLSFHHQNTLLMHVNVVHKLVSSKISNEMAKSKISNEMAKSKTPIHAAKPMHAPARPTNAFVKPNTTNAFVKSRTSNAFKPKTSTVVVKPKITKVRFMCEVCNVNFPTELRLIDHLNSMFHATVLRKLELEQFMTQEQIQEANHFFNTSFWTANGF